VPWEPTVTRPFCGEVKIATVPGTTHRHITWYGADLDLSLARGWFLSLSGTREKDPDGTTTQFYGSMTWRF
jgi:hypothetical protein